MTQYITLSTAIAILDRFEDISIESINSAYGNLESCTKRLSKSIDVVKRLNDIVGSNALKVPIDDEWLNELSAVSYKLKERSL